MFLRSRTESDLLKLLGFLNGRMSLTEDVLKQYLYLKKGYEGEVAFDQLTAANLNQDIFILNDIMLEICQSKFKIDSSLIIQDTIIPCEVKNFEGNYFYKDGEFLLCDAKTQITNPLHQVKRAEILLQQYLKKNGFHFRIIPYLIINPKFFLYQAPQNDTIIFPPQLSSFMEKLNLRPSNQNGIQQRKLADKMIADHIIESPYPKLPPYNYHSLKKGLTCAMCGSFLISCSERKDACTVCGFEEEIESAIVRGVEELKMLFPDFELPLMVFLIGVRWLALGKPFERF
ncbi:nuclease-related domain-containing protein [Neobacillus sp. DY30]|uniref:nuclease-related domain-containing protein n=1 Tax=Neobacillus sp. DY30 TaxID=3047871 RepID=UPI0024BF9884|nr:nuclease-related domain-containing protein [Neobacillus sp. DY30]WHY00943.1 nuclease-related domain-containing protein [Neobacillus sp. DY30]